MFKTRSAVIAIVLILGVIGMELFSSRKEVKPAPLPEVTATKTTATPPAEDTVVPTPSESPVTRLPKSALKLSPKDQRKIVVLQQILQSKNDNDPRMDKDLINLNPAVKHAMEAYYSEIPSEKRNDRGTIVFLIGRQITEKSDIDFLKNVLMEKSCLSLSDCSKPATASSGESVHLDGINETTANYPQLMAIKQYVEQYRLIAGNPNADQSLNIKIIDSLQEATRSPNAKVVNDAERALHYLTGRK